MSKSRLLAVKPKEAAPIKSKCLVYGAPGAGKSWTALDFPTCYYIDTEGGANLPHYTAKLDAAGGVYLGPEQGACDFPTVLEQVQALMSERHPYRTLVIDSISKLFNTAIANESQRIVDAKLKDEYGASKKPAVASMRRLVALLSRLDMNVILISHEKDEYGGSGTDREVIGKTFDAWDRLEYELDLCLHIRKQGPSRKAFVRKSRLKNFADAETFPWSYEEFAARYGRDVLESAAVPVTFATAEQVSEIETLLKLVNLPDGTVEKWLSKAGASTFREMDADQIAKCIGHVRGQLPPSNN
jgi:hypothetical protein